MSGEAKEVCEPTLARPKGAISMTDAWSQLVLCRTCGRRGMGGKAKHRSPVQERKNASARDSAPMVPLEQ